MEIVKEILTDSLPLLKTDKIVGLNTYQLFREANIIDYPLSGIPIYTPYGFKIFEKLRKLLQKKAAKYGLTEMLLSILQPQDFFLKSGRHEIFQDGIFSTQSPANYILSPTSEEQIIDVLSRRIRGYRSLPIHLYQIRQLFRNNSAHGVTRNKEFIVFESYSVHITLESLIEVFTLYDHLFQEVLKELGIVYFKHRKYKESHYIDYLFLTKDGEYKFDEEFLREQVSNYTSEIKKASSICMGMIVNPEIANRFKFRINKGIAGLGDVHVGTFGLGLIRALTAVIEQQRDSRGVNLPSCLQPYAAIFIVDGTNLDFEESLKNFLRTRGDIVIDNRKCDRRYKIKYAFFIGVSKVIFQAQNTLGSTHYVVINREEEEVICDTLQQLDNLLNKSVTNTAQIDLVC